MREGIGVSVLDTFKEEEATDARSWDGSGEVEEEEDEIEGRHCVLQLSMRVDSNELAL